MNLSKPQRRALVVLGNRGEWTRSGYYQLRTNTLDSLVDAGLIERRHIYPTLQYEYRLTEDGRRLLNGGSPLASKATSR